MKKVMTLLEKTRNPHEIAEQTGVKLSTIREIMREEPSPLPGWGRPSLQPYILSRRRAFNSGWPLKHSQLLIDHKRLHDQGRVIMCQGRDGDWIIQYAIPVRGKPIRNATYFYGG